MMHYNIVNKKTFNVYNTKHLNIINNLYYDDLDKYNSQSLNLKSQNIQRSQSASIINLKNNFLKSN